MLREKRAKRTLDIALKTLSTTGTSDDAQNFIDLFIMHMTSIIKDLFCNQIGWSQKCGQAVKKHRSNFDMKA